MIKKFILPKLNQGTTLVEALVAIYILSMGIIPSLAAILLANSLTSLIKDNLIAANLAQEGVEVVRAIRDENWFNNRSFDTGLSDGVYRVEWSSTSLLSESGNPTMRLNSKGIYNYSTGTDTPFHRRITITKIDPLVCNCELKIVVEVSWLEKKKLKTASIESHLFNWK